VAALPRFPVVSIKSTQQGPHIGIFFIAKQPAPAPHLAHPEGIAALRIVLVTAPRVSRSCEHFPDGFDLHLLQGPHSGLQRDFVKNPLANNPQNPTVLHLEGQRVLPTDTGVPHSQETAPPPRAATGPYVYCYCRVLGGRCFL